MCLELNSMSFWSTWKNWPLSQNFCWRQRSSSVQLGWYSPRLHLMHFVWWASVQWACTRNPVREGKKKGRKKEREDGSEKTDDCDHKSSAVLLVCFTADIRRLCWVFWCLYYLAHTFCSIWSLLGNGFHHTGWVWTPSISHLFHLSFEDPVGNGSQSLQSHSEIHYHNILGFLWFIV